MNFPGRAVEIVLALYKANPQNDDERRVHIQRVGEQLCYELGPNWGNKKRAGLSDAFRSPDSIAYREADGTIFSGDRACGTDHGPLAANRCRYTTALPPDSEDRRYERDPTGRI